MSVIKAQETAKQSVEDTRYGGLNVNCRIYVLMILAALFWSGAFITGKLAVQQFPVFTLTFFRFFIALPFIFIILKKMEPAGWRPSKRQWIPLIILGFLGTFLYHVLFFYSLKHTTAINCSLIGSTLPMVTTIIAIIFVHEKITFLRAMGIILAFSGICLVVTDGNWEIVKNIQFNYGDTIMFIAVICWAAYGVLSRVFMMKYNLSPIAITNYTFLVCAVLSMPLTVWEMSNNYIMPSITLGGWLSVIYMAIFPSVFGYLFQLIAVKKIGAPRTAIFVNLVPIFTIIQAVFFLGETFSYYKFASTLIIIAGVYLASQTKSWGNKAALIASK